MSYNTNFNHIIQPGENVTNLAGEYIKTVIKNDPNVPEELRKDPLDRRDWASWNSWINKEFSPEELADLQQSGFFNAEGNIAKKPTSKEEYLMAHRIAFLERLENEQAWKKPGGFDKKSTGWHDGVKYSKLTDMEKMEVSTKGSILNVARNSNYWEGITGGAINLIFDLFNLNDVFGNVVSALTGGNANNPSFTTTALDDTPSPPV